MVLWSTKFSIPSRPLKTVGFLTVFCALSVIPFSGQSVFEPVSELSTSGTTTAKKRTTEEFPLSLVVQPISAVSRPPSLLINNIINVVNLARLLRPGAPLWTGTVFSLKGGTLYVLAALQRPNRHRSLEAEYPVITYLLPSKGRPGQARSSSPGPVP